MNRVWVEYEDSVNIMKHEDTLETKVRSLQRSAFGRSQIGSLIFRVVGRARPESDL